MFIGVKYVSSDGEIKDREYTYYTELEVEENEYVNAPVGPSDTLKRAIVTSVDLPEPSFACKEITEYWVANDITFESEGTAFRTEEEINE